jgi:protein SCO1/2
MKAKSVLVFLCLVASFASQGQDARSKYLQGVGIDQKLNAQLPLQSQFKDEFGRRVSLGSYFGKRPAVLALVYYTCPALCDQILHGVVATMRPLSLRPGRDFDVIAISINPDERPSDAAEKRLDVVNAYSRGTSPNGFHFLTGNQQSIRAVADSVGFHYRYDPASKMFFHGAGIMVITPEGKVARYLYGVYYEPKDLKLSLIEASHNRIGTPVDRVLLYCSHYDAATGKYSATVLSLLHVSAMAFLLVLIAGFAFLLRRDVFHGNHREEVAHR